MSMRSITSALLLSGAIASALAFAQSPDKTDQTDKADQTEKTDKPDQVDQAAGPNSKTPPSPDSSPRSPDRIPELPPSVYRAVVETPAYVFRQSQDADRLYATPAPTSSVQYQVPAYAPSFSLPPGSHLPGAYPISPEEVKQVSEFRAAVEQLRRADTAEKKNEARERLNQMVSAQLDRDFKDREQKLAAIEARAKELREQLELRRSSKAEIQKMLLMMIESPDAGLGLPPAWMNSLTQPRTMVPVPASGMSAPYPYVPMQTWNAYGQPTEPANPQK